MKLTTRHLPTALTFLLAGIGVLTSISQAYSSHDSDASKRQISEVLTDKSQQELTATGSESLEDTPQPIIPDEVTRARIVGNYSEIPLHFERNTGRYDQSVKYISRGNGYALFLTQEGAVLRLSKTTGRPYRQKLNAKLDPAQLGQKMRIQKGRYRREAVLRMKFEGANPHAVPKGEGGGGTVNYFTGNTASKWRTSVSTYASVKYQQIYSGVDLEYYGNQKELEYDLIVSPGTDPKGIGIGFYGSKRLTIEKAGDLSIKILGGEVKLRRPIAYQMGEGGERQVVEVRYELRGSGKVGLNVGKYDTSRVLVVDPVLVYSTFFGGSSDAFFPGDNAQSIAVDSSGNAYIVGTTFSVDFPVANPIQGQLLGGGDAFIAKVNAAGNGLIYSSYLGGTGGDQAYKIVVDASGNSYIGGFTTSTDFPTVNPFQSQNHGDNDAFIAKLNAAGNALIYSTYLGGSALEYCFGLAVDISGNAYVTGMTASGDFPTVNSFRSQRSGQYDAFVAKLNSAGNALVYSTYLGGSAEDSANAIAVDQFGNAHIVGHAASSDFPTLNPLSSQLHSSGAFIAKLSATGNALIYSTYLGAADNGTAAFGVAVDVFGNAYVVGETISPSFPVVNAIQPQLRGECDAFVAKLNPNGNALTYATYLGGSGCDIATGITIEKTGSMFVVGRTNSIDFPIANPIQPKLRGGFDVFLTKLEAAGNALVYSTYLGGSGDDSPKDVAVDTLGNAYIVGESFSSDFPTVNSIQSESLAFSSPFMAKIAEIPSSATDLAILQRASFKSVVAGSTFTDVITVKNNGPSEAKEVVITTSTPPGTTFNFLSIPKGSSSSPAAGGSGQIICSIGSMEIGESVNIALTLNVVSGVGSTITNTASVKTSTPEPITVNNVSAISTLVIAPSSQADVKITNIKHSALFFANNAGAPFFYTVFVTNDGPVTAPNVQVTITMPENTTFERVIASVGTGFSPPVGGRGDIVWLLGSIPAGVSVEITVAVKFQINSSFFDVSATVTSTAPDAVPSNNSRREVGSYRQHSDQVQPVPVVVAPTSVAAGTRLTYSISVDVTSIFRLYILPPEGTTFSSVRIDYPPGVGVTTPSVGEIGPIIIDVFSYFLDRSNPLIVTIDVNVLARPGTVLQNLVGIGGLANSIVKTSTTVAGGSIVDLLWQQPMPPNNPGTASFAHPFNLQVRPSPSFFSRREVFMKAITPSEAPSCIRVRVNIYKADLPNVQTIPSNLWKTVPPDQVDTTMAAAPVGSFYVLTNVWNCGGLEIESGPSNECSSSGSCTSIPQILRVERDGKNLVITGMNFVEQSRIFVDEVQRKTIYQSETKLMGKKLAKTMSSGAKIIVRNPDGSISTPWVY
jgi:uncharacterized repeat protein (TIGR01451 family)